jgi:hypothetical protein
MRFTNGTNSKSRLNDRRNEGRDILFSHDSHNATP